MAKRKRLGPVDPGQVERSFDAPAPSLLNRAPIADVASEASSQAALEEVSNAMARARDEGRMILRLPLSDIDQGYLVRDRIVADDAEMEALKASLAERGQQMPVEVVEVAPGQYGLISGWRRCRALAALAEERGEEAHVLALLRKPAEMSDAYLAMVEENEIRANLSFFERARIAAKSVDQGVFETEKQALQALYAAASRAKRSKIKSFLPLVRELDGALAHPQAIGERLGLKLSKRMSEEAAFAGLVRARLNALVDPTPEAELNCLTAALSGRAEKPTAKPGWTDHEVGPALVLRQHHGKARIELLGAGANEELRVRLVKWLAEQGNK